MLTKIILGFFLSQIFFYPARSENGHLPDSMPVIAVTFMGAHNAAMSSAEGWVYAQQNQRIEDLWKSGVRMIKIPMQWYKPSGVKETIKSGFNKVKEVITHKKTAEPVPYLALCHEFPGSKNCIITKVQRGGKDPQRISQLFKRLANLLRNNPNEIFILKIEDYITARSEMNGTQKYDNDTAIQVFVKDLNESGLAEFAIDLAGHNQPLTLGEMRKINKRVIILDTANISGMPNYINSFRTYSSQTHWDTEKMKDCDLAKSNPAVPLFFEVNNGPEVSLPSNTVTGKVVQGAQKIAKGLNINLSLKAKLAQPSNYKEVNSKKNVTERIEQCRAKHNMMPNIITSDYSNVGDIRKVVRELNDASAKNYLASSA